MNKAILLVSFGTSHNDAREKTLDVMLSETQESFPEYRVYRAWTSRMILKKLASRDNLHIFNVGEAMEQMIADGVKELVVQPTHFINGIENERMIQEVLTYGDRIPKIAFGAPLLNTTADNEEAIRAAMSEYEEDRDAAIVWMGHGTTHHANNVYAALDYMMKDLGYENAFLGTVEAYPSLESLFRRVRAYGTQKVILAPFMMVAGDHAKNDMSGENPESWKNQFETGGFLVECRIRGLGENPGIRRLFLKHTREAVNSLECADAAD